MSRFTPGPWKYFRDFDYWSIEPTNIGDKDNQEGNEADYLLAAAAPDLLEALEECVGWLELAADGGPMHRTLLKANAAIAKAKGES